MRREYDPYTPERAGTNTQGAMSADATEEQIERVAGDHQALAAPAHDPSLLRAPFGTAGNQAVGRLLRAVPDVRSARAIRAGTLGNRAVGRVLARYEAFEHAKQGDHAKGSLTITRPFSSGGLQANISLTSGEINALADLYASPEELEHADAVELAKLKALIARQLAGEKVEESEWDKATGGRDWWPDPVV